MLSVLAVSLLVAPDAGFTSPLDLCELPSQEIVKRAKATTILFALPASDADSLGFLSENARVTVKACALGWCEVASPLATGFVLDTLLVAVDSGPHASPAPAPNPKPDTARAEPPRRACCRICRTGKACGNSCIARNKTCRQPTGCACNGGAVG
jgi:hypothetical protein